MSQSDKTLDAGQSGSSFRVDVQGELRAVNSDQAGATAPTNPQPYENWADTTSGFLKERNGANSAYNFIRALDADGGLRRGNANPTASVTPAYDGELYYDQINKQLYVARGPLSSSWQSLTTLVALPPNYRDTQVEYVAARQVQIKAGSRLRSADNAYDLIFGVDEIADLDASGAGGLDTGALAANTAYYLYAIYNPATLAEKLMFSTVNESVTGSITLPLGFSAKAQLQTAVITDSSSNIRPFWQIGKEIIYQDFQSSDLSVTGATSVAYQLRPAFEVFTAVDLSAFVPPVASQAILAVFVRPTGSSSHGQIVIRPSGFTDFSLRLGESQLGDRASGVRPVVKIPMSTNRQVEVTRLSTTFDIFIDVLGWEVKGL